MTKTRSLAQAIMPRGSSKGFTLIELLLVVALVAVLAAIAAPSMLTILNRQRAVTARDQILQAIRLAQTEAQRTRRSVTVSFDPAQDPPTVTVRGLTENLGRGDLEPGMVSLEAIANNGDDVTDLTFNADGGLDVDNTPEPPIIFTVSTPAGGATKRCVIIETLLGATRDGIDDECTP